MKKNNDKLAKVTNTKLARTVQKEWIGRAKANPKGKRAPAVASGTTCAFN
jgi:hypothetical protein